MLLLVDANVLIDYAQADPTVLALVAHHLGPVHVPQDVLDEVDQLDEEACDRLGLKVVEGTLGQVLEAGAGGGGLSFPDWMCLILARDHGWTCVTNDGRLRTACAAEGVSVLWGLQLMVQLVDAGELDGKDAIGVAEAIEETNPWLSARVVAAFREKVCG
jgi:hypothetical protein